MRGLQRPHSPPDSNTKTEDKKHLSIIIHTCSCFRANIGQSEELVWLPQKPGWAFIGAELVECGAGGVWGKLANRCPKIKAMRQIFVHAMNETVRDYSSI